MLFVVLDSSTRALPLERLGDCLVPCVYSLIELPLQPTTLDRYSQNSTVKPHKKRSSQLGTWSRTLIGRPGYALGNNSEVILIGFSISEYYNLSQCK